MLLLFCLEASPVKRTEEVSWSWHGCWWRSWPRERGQGTVEYVALITLVALVMLGVVTAMKSAQFTEGQQLGSLILKKIAEAVEKVHY